MACDTLYITYFACTAPFPSLSVLYKSAHIDTKQKHMSAQNSSTPMNVKQGLSSHDILHHQLVFYDWNDATLPLEPFGGTIASLPHTSTLFALFLACHVMSLGSSEPHQWIFGRSGERVSSEELPSPPGLLSWCSSYSLA